jgi:glutamyl-tRNA reductase
MLSEKQIQQALHASRVVPLAVAKPHGPLGLEQLAAAVSRVNPALGSGDLAVRRPIALDHATWEKLEQLANTATQTTSQRVTASQVAAAIIEQFVAALSQQGETQE